MVAKPGDVYDREREWGDLERFLGRSTGRLGIVWGPRRVGKSYLLGSLCDAVGGLYVQGIRQDAVLYLASLGQAVAEHTGAPAPLRFDDWAAAVTALLDLPDTPLVVLDEFPYLVESSPELPTLVQSVVDRRRALPGRLLLCGSAVSQMTRLFAGDGPLYRRAALALPLRPFDLPTAARFWRLADRPLDALAVHAVVGGTPGYWDVLGPVDGDIDRWIIERVLDPTTAVFNEDDLAFATDPTLPDSQVYRSILAALAAGERTPSGVARAVGRPATSLVRPIDRLVAAGMVVRTPDVLRAKRSLLDMGDPFLRFHQAIIRPNAAALARRRGAEVWERSRGTFRSQVLGPHVERVCRDAVLDAELGLPRVARVGVTTVYDADRSTTHEVDVVGLDEQGEITLLGEVESSETPRTTADLDRLDHIRSLLAAGGRAERAHLAVFAAAGADRELARAAKVRHDVTIIDAATLCGL